MALIPLFKGLDVTTKVPRQDFFVAYESNFHWMLLLPPPVTHMGSGELNPVQWVQVHFINHRAMAADLENGHKNDVSIWT